MLDLHARRAPQFGIVTALPHEFKAVVAYLDEPKQIEFGHRGAGQTYVIGTMPSHNGEHTVAALLLPDIGNNSASVGAALLSANLRSLQCIFMTGVAGGIPNANVPAEHVRLGDIVVSDRDGVVQYDAGKALADRFLPRYPPRPPSARMLQAARMLMATNFATELQSLISMGLNACGFSRPPDNADVLCCSRDPRKAVPHPSDPTRTPGFPRVFLGPIASANQVLKNALKRDQLRDEYRAKAVEMEGSGVADATWTRSIEYFVVRGICDYCDSNKRDDWQSYAAVTAAAYTRLLLSTVPSQPGRSKRRLSFAMACIPLLALAGLALNTTHETPDSRVYIQTAHLPVQVEINGRFVQTLTTATQFASIEVPAGEYMLVAMSNAYLHRQRVQVRPGETVMVDLPPAVAVMGVARPALF
jgi:nucleoside phosphorylase